ncbi:uncharacterized protein LOC144160606 [Haemaphysalis longicornis]
MPQYDVVQNEASDLFGTSSPAASSATELTPVHERTSRRLRGLPVEFQPMTSRPTRMATRDASTVTSGTGTAPSYFVVHQPRTPKVFYGDSFEDGEDWLDQFERVANFNGWNEQHKLHNVYYALEESARTWFENHEATLTPWNEFRRRFLATYACTDRREKAESALQARNQRPNESVTMYVEDMARLFRRADPAMSEEKKLRHLMRGVKQDVFAGLVRNPPQSVSAFLAEATAIERALLQRARQYSRDITFMSSDAPSVEQGNGGLRELVRSIVREELQNLHGVQQLQASMPLAEAIRREVRQAVGAPEAYEAPQRQYGVPQEPYGVPQQQTQVASYAAALRESDRYVAPTLAAATPQTTLGLRPRAMLTVDEARRPRKSDEWRTPDQRPLCFHCGEASHIYRACPYRRLGLRGFPPHAPRPKYGERPAEIESYLAERRNGFPQQRPDNRSPSPMRRRSSSPSPSQSSRRRSPSPSVREN